MCLACGDKRSLHSKHNWNMKKISVVRSNDKEQQWHSDQTKPDICNTSKESGICKNVPV